MKTFIDWLKANDEYQQGERLRLIILIPVLLIGLLICSDGRAEDIKCATVTVIETGGKMLSCVDIETSEYIDCTQKENAKKCHLTVLENY